MVKIDIEKSNLEKNKELALYVNSQHTKLFSQNINFIDKN